MQIHSDCLMLLFAWTRDYCYLMIEDQLTWLRLSILKISFLFDVLPYSSVSPRTCFFEYISCLNSFIYFQKAQSWWCRLGLSILTALAMIGIFQYHVTLVLCCILKLQILLSKAVFPVRGWLQASFSSCP